MNRFNLMASIFTAFTVGVFCGVYVHSKIEGDREGLIQRITRERDEWRTRHDDLQQQWEREKRPRPWRSEGDPDNHVMKLDHESWGCP